MKSVEEVLGKVLGIDPKKINDKSSPENINAWDSFNGLLLVTELENNFRVNFSVDEVISVKNVGDIRKILKKHGINP